MTAKVRMFFIVAAVCFVFTCKSEDKNDGNDGGGGTGTGGDGAGDLPTGALVLKGSLENGEDANNKSVLKEKDVLLKKIDGSVLGSAKSDKDGNYEISLAAGTLATEETSLTLTDSSVSSAATDFIVESTVEDDGDGKALGVRKNIRINKNSVTGSDGDAGVVEVGTSVLKEIGAITGTVSFEDTEVSPEGTDVFIPGKSFFVRTAEDGKFHLLYVPAGEHILRIENGVYVKEITTTVEQDKTTNLEDTEVSSSNRNPRPISDVLIGTWNTKCWSGSSISVDPPSDGHYQGTLTVTALDNIIYTGGNCLSGGEQNNGSINYIIYQIFVLSENTLVVKRRPQVNGALEYPIVKVYGYTNDKITLEVGSGGKVDVMTRTQ